MRRILTATLATCGMLASFTVASASWPAAADPLSDAKAKAATLQKQVSALQLQVEQASERYDAAEAQLGDLVGQQRLAQRRVDAAKAQVDANRNVVNARARALYMSGGTFALYASLIQGGSPANLAAALHDVSTVTSTSQRALVAVAAADSDAQAAQLAVDALLQKQNDLTAAANEAQTEVQQALSNQQAALNDANTQVRSIEEQIQAQIDADNAARAAALLAAAQQAAADGGYTDTGGSAVAQAAIAAASTQLGKPYVYGGSGPDVWDCSGLTQWAFRQAGVYLPRTAAQQYAAVPTKIPLGQLEPGDLLFWATDLSNAASIHHVAIYVGNGQMLAAPHTGTVVQLQPVYLDGYFGAVRPA